MKKQMTKTEKQLIVEIKMMLDYVSDLLNDADIDILMQMEDDHKDLPRLHDGLTEVHKKLDDMTAFSDTLGFEE